MQPGPWGMGPAPARDLLLLLLHKGTQRWVRAAPSTLSTALPRARDIPFSRCFSPWFPSGEGTGDPHPLDPAGPWLFVHLLLWEGFRAGADPSSSTAPGRSLGEFQAHWAMKLPLPTLPAVCSAQGKAGVGEMKQNQSIALSRACTAQPANITRDLWEKWDPHGNSHSNCCLISCKPYLM